MVAILLIIAGCVLILLLAVSFWFAVQVVLPKMVSVKRTYDIEVENGRLDESQFNKLPKLEVTIQSPFGYNLFGILFPVEGSKKIVLISHGFRYGLYGSVKFLNLFLPRGYSVLLFDLRHHGRSGGSNVTFGWKEKHDVKTWVDWSINNYGAEGVGSMGESLGAGVALQHAAIDPRLAFVIADCPFSDLQQLLRFNLKKKYHMPGFPLIQLANFWCWLLTGMTFARVSPIRNITEMTTPLFLAHGMQDDFIPASMSRDLYAAKIKGIRRLYLAPNAGHAEAYWKNQEEYHHLVGEFLKDTKV
jgi:pimeloyl-ACP methyl ester carboxylesterase